MKPGDYGKKTLNYIFLFILLFILLNQYTFLKTGIEQTVLITAVFTFATTEVVNLRSIKINKIKSDYERRSKDESMDEYNDNNSSTYNIDSDVERRI